MAKPPVRHHYLPQSYLNGFGHEKVIWVYDRFKKEVRAQLIVDTTVKRHFYSIESPDGSRDTRIELFLANINGLIPRLISEIRDGNELSDESRYELGLVVAFLWNRTPDFHEGIERVEVGFMKKHLQMSFQSEEDVARSLAEWKAAEPNVPDLDPKKAFDFYSKGEFHVKIHRNRSVEHMIANTPEQAQMLSRLDILVMHAPKGSAFITTDRPFVITRPSDTIGIPPWVGVGLLTPAAAKLLALTNDIALMFGDPGARMIHRTLNRPEVKAFNAQIGLMTDRFLLGRDKALVEAWSKRLDLANQPKITGMDLA